VIKSHIFGCLSTFAGRKVTTPVLPRMIQLKNPVIFRHPIAGMYIASVTVWRRPTNSRRIRPESIIYGGRVVAVTQASSGGNGAIHRRRRRRGRAYEQSVLTDLAPRRNQPELIANVRQQVSAAGAGCGGRSTAISCDESSSCCSPGCVQHE